LVEEEEEGLVGGHGVVMTGVGLTAVPLLLVGMGAVAVFPAARSTDGRVQ
jgi:hypothetical protein